jgi:hypothetical protein
MKQTLEDTRPRACLALLGFALAGASIVSAEGTPTGGPLQPAHFDAATVFNPSA